MPVYSFRIVKKHLNNFFTNLTNTKIQQFNVLLAGVFLKFIGSRICLHKVHKSDKDKHAMFTLMVSSYSVQIIKIVCTKFTNQTNYNFYKFQYFSQLCIHIVYRKINLLTHFVQNLKTQIKCSPFCVCLQCIELQICQYKVYKSNKTSPYPVFFH